jgi:hypothetical protein
MKKLMLVAAVFSIAASSFGIITTVQINTIQQQGAVATYDPVLGKLEFRQGASATLYDDLGNEYAANSVITANFTGVTDTSAGGWASATFSTVLDWEIQFFDGGVQVGFISGNGNGSTGYTEVEGRTVIESLPWGDEEVQIDADQLFGAGVVSVLEYNLGYFGGAVWEDVDGGLAKMKSHSILTGTPYAGITDYQSAYETSLTTVWLYADETVIPEPATMVLLGLGGLLLRKRK